MTIQEFNQLFGGVLLETLKNPELAKIIEADKGGFTRLGDYMKKLDKAVTKAYCWVNKNLKEGQNIENLLIENGNKLIESVFSNLNIVRSTIKSLSTNPKYSNKITNETKKLADRISRETNDVDLKLINIGEKLSSAEKYKVDKGLYFPDSQFDKKYKMTNKLQNELFDHIPCAEDIAQDDEYACYLLAPLRVIAANHPEKIMDLIHDNGDGTVTVKFYPLAGTIDTNFTGEKNEMLVTVENTRPGIDKQSAPWVRLFEKAIAASRIIGSSGCMPLKEDLTGKITIRDLDGGEPLLSLSALDPTNSGYPDGRAKANTMLKSMNNMDEVERVLEKQISDAKEKGMLMCLCDGGHVITVTGIEKDPLLHEVTLKCYDQWLKVKRNVTLNNMLSGNEYDRFVMYDFGGQGKSHEASYYSLIDIQNSVQQHARDKNYTVPPETTNWANGVLKGEIKLQEQIKKNEEVKAEKVQKEEPKKELNPQKEKVKAEKVQKEEPKKELNPQKEVVEAEEEFVVDEKMAMDFALNHKVLSSERPFAVTDEDITFYKDCFDPRKVPGLNTKLNSTKISELSITQYYKLADEALAMVNSNVLKLTDQSLVDRSWIHHLLRYTAARQDNMLAKNEAFKVDEEKLNASKTDNKKYIDELNNIIRQSDLFKSHLVDPVPVYEQTEGSYLKTYEKNREKYINKLSNSFGYLSEDKKNELIKEAEKFSKGHPYINGTDVMKYFIYQESEILRLYNECVDPDGMDTNLPDRDIAPFTLEAIGRTVGAKAKAFEFKKQADQKEQKEPQPNLKQEQKENNPPRDFRLFVLEAGRIRERTTRTSIDVPNGGDCWAPVKKALDPLRQRLREISNEDDPQKIDVDSLYDLYRNVIDTLDASIKQAPQSEKLKKVELFVKEAYSKEELKASVDAYIADFKNPIDVDKLVKPKNPLKYSKDPLQKKMQQAALKQAFWNKFGILYSNDGSEEVINKKYNQCAKAIEDGTDENMRIFNRIDKSKIEMLCDMVLTKGSTSSLIDFNVYMSDDEPFRKVQTSTQQAFETFFNPKTKEGVNKFYNNPIKKSQQIVEDANQKIHSIELTVPEGLEDNDVAMLTAAELLSDKIIGGTFKRGADLKLGGSSIPKDTDWISSGRDAFANSLLGGDERSNMQYMRYGIAEARTNAKSVLKQYQSGNKKPMADVLLSSLVQNAKYQKLSMQVDDTTGAFYTKCISDTIKLLDSDKFKGLVEIPQEVRDIDKLNKAHLKMTEEAAELKVKLNDYCITKILSGSMQNPKDDPEFVKLYSKWYARASHLDMEKVMSRRKQESAGTLNAGYEVGKNRELTGFERKVLENADEYISLREEFFLNSNAKEQLFEKDYKSWKDILSNKIKITENAAIKPVIFDIEDAGCFNQMRFAIESLDDKKYSGVKKKLLSKAPFDGTKLSRNASKAEIDFRLKQYDDFMNYFDSLNLGDIPSAITKDKLEVHYLRKDLEFPIQQLKKQIISSSKTVIEARKFEKTIGIFEKESNELQELQEKKYVASFTGEVSRLTDRINKTYSDKQKNSNSYEGLQTTLSDCVKNTKKIKTVNDLKDTLKNLDKSADDYLREHANEKQGIFKSCGAGRRERIKTCARIKTMKELLDQGIAYDSPKGKKAMLACKLVCAEKLKQGFSGFKELCQDGAIKDAIDAKLNDPVFNIAANKALESDALYDKLVKMSGSDCLNTFSKAMSKAEKSISKDNKQVKEQAVNNENVEIKQ